MILKIYEWYYNFFTNKKKINKRIFIATLVHAGYFIIYSLSNKTTINVDDTFMPIIYYLLFLLIQNLFHKWIGQYWILKLQTWQTKEFQKEVMPKNIKCSGKRGGYKDSSNAGMMSNFVKCSIEQINEEIENIRVHLFYFDLKKVDEFISSNIEIFNVASKKKKKENFMNAIVNNDAFLKKKYLNIYDEIMVDFAQTAATLRTSDSKYIVTDSVNFKHTVELLYDYMYYRWRLEIDIWIITNQPCMQYYDFKTKTYKMAKIYSPDLKATKTRTVRNKEGKHVVEYITIENMIAEDWLAFWESECDIWWNNIDSDIKKNIEERGIRWYEVAMRHIMGEHVLSIRNGQVAGRTVKIQRDLEESFYTVTRAVKVYGGAKRIFFIKLLMCVAWPVFLIKKNWKSKLEQKISQLRMSGWLKLEVAFSRNESINFQAPGLSLSQLLDTTENLYLSQYQTTLVYYIRDCWGKYNTHYLNYMSDKITETSEAALVDLPEWDVDMQLHEEDIIEMNYDTVDLFKIDKTKQYGGRKYKKVEKQNSNVMRLDL